MMRTRQWLALMLTATAVVTETIASAQDSPAPSCRTGFVWRLAFPRDYACVTPEARAQAVNDNAAAIDRRQPGGAYGPDTCTPGFVWREARANDTVCVTPEVRAATAEDNRLAASRVASATAVPPASKARELPPVQKNPADLPTHGTPVPLGPKENPRCREYADQAVSSFKTMQSNAKCTIPSGGRWNANWQGHYDWCMGAAPGAIANEMHQRSTHLVTCGALKNF